VKLPRVDRPPTTTPYKFVQFDWNPNGHEPDSVYTVPHVDFHFYTVPVEVRNSIVPSAQGYAQMAANKPAQQYWYPFHVDAATLGGGIPESAASVRITWDAQQKEYRIALTQLSWRD